MGLTKVFDTNGFYTEEFASFWVDRFGITQKSPVVIAGAGFDPRSMQSVKILMQNGITPQIIPIEFIVDSSEDGEGNLEKATKMNKDLINDCTVLTSSINVKMYDAYDKPIGGREVVNQIYKSKIHLNDQTDVILDIGGLPRSLFAPLLSFLFKEQDMLNFRNLHVASLPDESLDSEIISDEILAPSNMYGFESFQSEDKLVWIPIIGKNDPERLRKIYQKIERNCIEICPVLPFKPNNPRQVDNLLYKLHDLLFHEIQTISNNIIYIDHSSPFMVYKEIVELSEYYKKLLGDLPGDVKVLITPLDDKTSCVGAVLAASTNDLPIMYADTVSYRVKGSDCLIKEINSEPVEIWLSGEAYDE